MKFKYDIVTALSTQRFYLVPGLFSMKRKGPKAIEHVPLYKTYLKGQLIIYIWLHTMKLVIQTL